MKPELCEVLSLYEVFSNDDDEVLITIAGYYRGEPENPTIYFDGKAHAVFARNGEREYVLMEEIHEHMRPLIAKLDKVLIKELDTKYEYYAQVVIQDVSRFVRQSLAMHDYFFFAHPYPQHTGAFKVVNDKCSVCRRRTEIGYKGKMYPRDEEYVICPDCISSKRAARKKNAVFTPAYTVPIPSCEAEEYITKEVPPIPSDGAFRPAWLFHCNAPSVYLGRADVYDLGDAIWDEILANWEYSLTDADITKQGVIREAIHAGDVEGHLFRCSKCHKHLMHFVSKDES